MPAVIDGGLFGPYESDLRFLNFADGTLALGEAAARGGSLDLFSFSGFEVKF